ncbi:sce7725 family protein [Bacillus sp. FSL M8-0049]|uniref:sce7725 family protein n=1 Tax=Bacillus sp. FSL M8-0049 TaxID=2954573 RepID=UPI00315967E1
MYYPIIRGRQYDLLALRELLEKNLLSEKVIPVIEPTKLSPTLVSTINSFKENSRKIILVSNPKIGSFHGELAMPSIYSKFLSLMSLDNVIIGHQLNGNSKNEIQKLSDDVSLSLENLVIFHTERKFIQLYREIYSSFKAYLNIIPSDNSFRRQLDDQNLVGLSDKFNKLPRNADYLEIESEFFSEEHLFYEKEGYIGFSDYSIVGAEYNTSGFAPYAVAFHIVYPNSEGGLEIMHFVSDSNTDISDPAGKFSEALEKMMSWYYDIKADKRMHTLAMQSFEDHHKKGTYPGLATIKKLSIMHHLELMGSLLSSRVK